MSDDSWRDVAAELAEDADWIRRIAAEICDDIYREIPQLAVDPQLAETTRQSVVENVRLFLSMVVAEVPAEQARPGRNPGHEYC